MTRARLSTDSSPISSRAEVASICWASTRVAGIRAGPVPVANPSARQNRSRSSGVVPMTRSGLLERHRCTAVAEGQLESERPAVDASASRTAPRRSRRAGGAGRAASRSSSGCRGPVIRRLCSSHKHVPQLAAVELAVVVARQLVDEVDAARALEVREAVAAVHAISSAPSSGVGVDAVACGSTTAMTASPHSRSGTPIDADVADRRMRRAAPPRPRPGRC